MKSCIKVDKCIVNEDTVYIHFHSDEVLSEFFKSNTFIYSCESCSIVPESILVVPFVCNVLPIIWLTDSTLILEELDKEFLLSIEEFKTGYKEMYPQLGFRGKLEIRNIVENKYETSRNLVLFSGGIDAICTTLRHRNEPIMLMTLWGSADFPVDDAKGWEIQWKNIQYTADKLGLNCQYIKSNFCEFVPIWSNVFDKLMKPLKTGWWHDFQHGIGILGHAAPYSYIHGVKTVYIASSFDDSRKPYTCASDPTIDNYVRYGVTSVCHDGYELDRQDKIKYIVDELKKMEIRLKIHVCLRQYKIENCCHCEKCYRTILGLLSEGCNPNDWGFSYKHSDLKRILNDFSYKINLPADKKILYNRIQKRIIENSDNITDKTLVNWANSVNIDNINDNYRKKIWNVYSNISNGVGTFLHNLKGRLLCKK